MIIYRVLAFFKKLKTFCENDEAAHAAPQGDRLSLARG